MAASLGAELVEWSIGAASVRVEVGADQVNFLGGGHGGVLFTLGDLAMSYASNSYGRIAVAIRIDISYLKAVAPGDELLATAYTQSVSRRFGHHQLDVHRGDSLVAQAVGTTFRTDDWHFGREAWPEDWPHA